MTERTLHDPRLEAILLGAMLMHGRIAEDCFGSLAEGDFHRPAHATVFAAMLEIHRAGSVPDPALVVRRLEDTNRIVSIGGRDFLLSLVGGIPSVNNYRSWAEAIREQSRLRQIAAALDGARERLEGGQSASEIAAYVQDETTNLGGSMSGVVSAAEVLREGEIPPDEGLPVRVPIIDDELSTGGAPKGQLGVVLAREGIGKSTLMLQMAVYAAWSGRGALFVSLADLNRQRLVSRVLRMRSGASSMDRAEAFGLVSAFTLARDDLRRVSFDIDDRTKRGSRDVDDIVDTIETLRRSRLGTERPLTDVFVDYAQKLTSRHFGPRDAYAASVYAASRLARYAENSGVSLWVGSQLTAGSEKDGSQDATKMGKHWQEEAGVALKITAGQLNARTFELVKSRFGAQFVKHEMVFDQEHVLFLPPGVIRPW